MHVIHAFSANLVSLTVLSFYVNGKINKKFIFFTLYHNCHFTHFDNKCQWLNMKNIIIYYLLFILPDIPILSN